MWIGTQSGLQRYDGTRFQNFITDIRDSSALQSDWISAIYEDSKMRLWIGNTLGDVYLLDRVSRKFYNYNLKQSQKIKIDGVWQITEDKKGVIWLAGHEGYFRLEDKTDVFEFYNQNLGIKPGVITSIMYVDQQNNLWLSTSEGIKMYNQSEKILYEASYNPKQWTFFTTKENASAIFKQGDTLWASFEHHVECYLFSTKCLKKYYFTSDYRTASKAQKGDLVLRYATRLNNGKIIVPLLGKGLAIYNPASDSFDIERAHNSKVYGYHNKDASEESVVIAEDKNANIIIGNSSGLNITNPSKQFFFNEYLNTSNTHKFPRAVVSDFLQIPSGDIFVSYYAEKVGIVQMDSNLQFKKHYLLRSKYENSGVNQVWQLFLRDNKTLLAPNQKGTSLELNLVTSTLRENKSSLFAGPVNMVKRDGENFWLGTWRNGLQKINIETGQRTGYASYIKGDNKFSNRVFSLLPKGDKIWVGTLEYGLVLMDKATGKTLQIFKKNRNIPNSISSNCVNDIIDYQQDTLILATERGLNIFNTRTQKFTVLTSREGLPNNFVLRLEKDDFGNVWATCGSGGFCKIDMKTLRVKSFSVEDGIIDNGFNGILYKLRNGNVLVGNSTGFMSFNPADFVKSWSMLSPAITGIYVFNKWWPFDLKNKTNVLKLNPNQNFVRIEFSLLSFLKEPGSKIFYRLQALDKAWVQADENNAAIYSNLSDGNYLFEVKSINRDGIESPVTSLRISLAPPFYKIWWFRFLAGGTILFLAFLGVKQREKNIKVTEDKKLHIQRLQTEQYRSRMEMEEIINYFSFSLVDKNSVEAVLWDVATNLIGKMGFEDCIIYLWNEDKTRMVQKAGLGVKNSPEKLGTMDFNVLPGQGIVGQVILTKEPLIIPDTSLDSRYRADDGIRASEISIPIIYEGKLLGVLDSEHSKVNFFSLQHLQILTTIATLISNKIVAIEAQQSMQKQKLELHYINEQLYKTKLEALRSQMNPHFIFNSLNAIQECILTGKVEAAYQYLSKFSKLQRMVLNHSEKELIPLEKEIEMLQLYLELESLRFSKSFTYSIEVNETSHEDDLMIPSMITQPFVENAIWHGLRNTPGEKVLKIVYQENGDKLSITVSDNGIGRVAAEKIKKEKLGMDQHESRGTILMQNRLSILERQLNVQIGLEIIDEYNPEGMPAGTTVHLTCPANL